MDRNNYYGGESASLSLNQVCCARGVVFRARRRRRARRAALPLQRVLLCGIAARAQ
jgi:hypothetical protein